MDIGTAVARLLTPQESKLSLPDKPVLPITTRDDLPALFDREADRSISDRVVCWWTGMGEDRGEPVLRRALTRDERGMLERRCMDLRRAVAPHTLTEELVLRGALAKVFEGFPALRGMTPGETERLAKAYLFAVREEPPWAIIETCTRVRDDSAGLNPNFCPPEPAFASVVRRFAKGYREQLAKAEALLTARIEPPVPPRLSREEIEAKLGRPVGDRDRPEQAPPVPRDTGYAARMRADLEARRQRVEAQGAVRTQDATP